MRNALQTISSCKASYLSCRVQGSDVCIEPFMMKNLGASKLDAMPRSFTTELLCSLNHLPQTQPPNRFTQLLFSSEKAT